jgi:hypothetical protein
MAEKQKPKAPAPKREASPVPQRLADIAAGLHNTGRELECTIAETIVLFGRMADPSFDPIPKPAKRKGPPDASATSGKDHG